MISPIATTMRCASAALSTAVTFPAPSSRTRRVETRVSPSYRSTVACVAVQAGAFWIVVGSHLLWRKAYYGEWLPNTYYAKVGGQTWWDVGLAYVAAFALEYGAYLWVPLIAAAVVVLVIYLGSLDSPEFRPVLKKAGLITRDSRIKERKKYGQRGARARFQFSKR